MNGVPARARVVPLGGGSRSSFTTFVLVSFMTRSARPNVAIILFYCPCRFFLGGSFNSITIAWVSVAPTFSEAWVIGSLQTTMPGLASLTTFSPSGEVYLP